MKKIDLFVLMLLLLAGTASEVEVEVEVEVEGSVRRRELLCFGRLTWLL